MNLASVQGAYNFGMLEDTLNNQNASRTGVGTGKIEFDGAGLFSIKGAEAFIQRQETCSGVTAGCAGISVTSGSNLISIIGGSYSVTSTGNISFTGQGVGGVQGTVSPDGSVITLAFGRDNQPFSGGAIGADSGRTLVVAVRQK